ncbi:MAG: DnaJ C-terminal domain-containing protein [Verrucomicrobiales bacterium]
MAVEFKDYYKILGVTKDASADDIRKSFRKLARAYHPDVAKDKKSAEEKFKEINEAYEVLGDEAKRKKYDTLGANWNRPQPPPGWQQSSGRQRGGFPGAGADDFEFQFGGTGFSDFFEQFFGGGGTRNYSDIQTEGRSGARQQRPLAGRDVEGEIITPLDEVMNGSVRSISYQRVNRATGKAETESFRVRIPVGVLEGQKIRVPGKGEHGINGGPPGDLFLRVRFARHPEFTVRENNLYHELELAPWEAMLGATIPAPTLDGSITMKIPPKTKHGQQFRVKGKGLPNQLGERGDLFVVTQIELPDELTAEERALWEKMAEISQWNPRGDAKR